MIRLHEMLTVLEVKRDAMLAEEKSLVSPQEEREKLFKQVGVTVVQGDRSTTPAAPLAQESPPPRRNKETSGDRRLTPSFCQDGTERCRECFHLC